jgi:hypothetical protein
MKSRSIGGLAADAAAAAAAAADDAVGTAAGAGDGVAGAGSGEIDSDEVGRAGVGATAAGAGAIEAGVAEADAAKVGAAEADDTGAGVGVSCRANGARDGAAGCAAAGPGAGDVGVNPSDGDGVGVGVRGGATDAAATGGGGNVGTTMPGGGAATAKGSSINSTGRSGNCSWKTEADGVLGVAGVAAAAAAVGARRAVAVTGGASVRGATDVAGSAGVRSAGAVTSGADVCGAGAVGTPSCGEDAESCDELVTEAAFAVETTVFGDGVAVAALLVGMPTGFDTPANVAPARRLAAALAAAAIFRAVAAAAGLIGAGAAAAGTVSPAALDTDTVAAGAFVSPRGNVPVPFVPSIRAGPPASETPNNTSGSSSSPAVDAVSVGIRAVSGRASGTGAATVGLADRSSKSPCESKSSPESIEGPFVELDETVDPMGSSTGRSARGSSLGREAASIVFEPASGDQSSTYPAMPSPRYLGDGSQIGMAGTRNVKPVTLFDAFPSR